MSWNTTVIIIVENIKSYKEAQDFGRHIFENDSKRFDSEVFYIIKEKSTYSVFYFYTRKKHLPLRVIDSYSKEHPSLNFTLIGSTLEYICGPAGIIRVHGGEIVDSYGISPEDSIRKEMLKDTAANKVMIFQWYSWNGSEMQLRNKQMNQIPLGNCQRKYVEKLIYIEEDIVKKEVKNHEKYNEQWQKQESFERFPTYGAYIKSLESNPLSQQLLSEENMIAYIKHSPIVKELENEVSKTLPDAFTAEVNPYVTYARISHVRTFAGYNLNDVFQSIGNLDHILRKEKERIIYWGTTILKQEKYPKIYKGLAILWYASLYLKAKSTSYKIKQLENECSGYGHASDLQDHYLDIFSEQFPHIHEYKVFGEDLLAVGHHKEDSENERPFHFVDSKKDLDIFEQEFREFIPEQFILLGYYFGGDPFTLLNKITNEIHNIQVSDFIDTDLLSRKLNVPDRNFHSFVKALRMQTVSCMMNPKKLSQSVVIEIRDDQLYCNYEYVYKGVDLKGKYISICREYLGNGLEMHYAPKWVYDKLEMDKE